MSKEEQLTTTRNITGFSESVLYIRRATALFNKQCITLECNSFSVKCSNFDITIRFDNPDGVGFNIPKDTWYYYQKVTKKIYVSCLAPLGSPAELEIFTNISLRDEQVYEYLRGISIADSEQYIKEMLAYPFTASTYTTVPLLAGATYTSSIIDFSNVKLSKISIISHSDVNSAVNGVIIQQSFNVAHMSDFESQFSSVAGVCGATVNLIGRYIIIKYINGAINQAHFRYGVRYNI